MSSDPADEIELSELDIIINTLKRGNSPTLIVEGKDDYIAFKDFEIENVSWGLTVLPVKGVQNVRKIIESVDDIKHPALAFLIDSDCAVFDHVSYPYARDDTFYTDGYSIENDLIRDGNVIKLLKKDEEPIFNSQLFELSKYFMCAACCHIEGKPGNPMSANAHMLFSPENSLHDKYASWILKEECGLDDGYKAPLSEPFKYIHGKSLLSLFTKHLSKSGRSSSFSAANILEIGGIARGECMKRIEGLVLSYFQSIGVAPTPHGHGSAAAGT